MAEPSCMSLDLLICTCEYPVILMTPCERELRVACCKELILSSNNLMLLYISHFINTI